MPMIKRCCFNKNLRCGSIAAGVYTMAYSTAIIGAAIFRLDKLYREPEKARDLEVEWSWVNVAIFFTALLCGAGLIIGVVKDKSYLLIPWMVMAVLLILVDATSIIYTLVHAGFNNYLIFVLVLWIIMTLIYIYSELCVLSHYQELKLGRGRREDYLAVSHMPVNTPGAVHVHVGDKPVNYIQSQHSVTAYSFHSQTLYEEETEDRAQAMQVIEGEAQDTILSNCNGRVLELRPVTSLPADMDTRFGSDNYLKGSIEMKIVDSKPVVIDWRTGQVSSQNGVQMSPVPGKMPKRFRTVSESAVKQPMLDDHRSVHATTNSLKNIAGLSKLCEGSEVTVNANGTNNKTTTSFTIGAVDRDQEQSLLSNQDTDGDESDQS